MHFPTHGILRPTPVTSCIILYLYILYIHPIYTDTRHIRHIPEVTGV